MNELAVEFQSVEGSEGVNDDGGPYCLSRNGLMNLN